MDLQGTQRLILNYSKYEYLTSLLPSFPPSPNTHTHTHISLRLYLEVIETSKLCISHLCIFCQQLKSLLCQKTRREQ